MTRIVEILESKNPEKSYKWSECPKGCRPFGVADMDVKTDRRICSAMEQVIKEGDFGYGRLEKYYESVLYWIRHRYNWNIQPEWLTYSPGVMVGMSILIELLTQEDDEIVVLSPVYNGFYNVITENKRKVRECPLVLDQERYEINFKEFEHCIESGAKLFLMCNPHNPVGRVWKQEEMIRLKDICKKNHVPIISDEIHADLTYSSFTHTPFLKCCEDYKDEIYVAISPSKAFNMASLYTANYIIPNISVRKRFEGVLHGEPNLLGCVATKAAYTQCEDWLDEMLEYIEENVEEVRNIISLKCPEIHITKPESTYMLWMDCRALRLEEEELIRFFREKAHMDINPGSHYGKNGKGFVRINVACKRESLEECIEMFCHAVLEQRRVVNE